jgi:phenylalanyl-tRNA synthetase beta subunit
VRAQPPASAKDIRLFETGSRFVPATGEGRAAALAWCGAADGPHWSAPARASMFFDVKGVIESVCATFGVAGGVRPGRVAVSRSRPRRSSVRPARRAPVFRSRYSGC